jgi:hypothetical protein
MFYLNVFYQLPNLRIVFYSKGYNGRRSSDNHGRKETVTEKPLAFLSLIKTLESTVGHKTSYALLDPFPCITSEGSKPALIPIQYAGKTIARHVGLDNLTFIISPTTLDPSTAGHIELRYGDPAVFVEISTCICTFKDAVLATLCHEVSHKFLHVNGIRHGNMQIEQEFLTDVAAVYLGMGKIMLNGCECQRSETRTEGDKTITTTHTLRTGYISRECFAFVYRLVCAMRRIPATQFLAGLSEEAKKSIAACEREYGHWFKSEYHLQEEVDRLCKSLQNDVEECQTESASCEYTLRRAGEAIHAMHSSIRESHKPLVEADQKITQLQKRNINPHLNFLECLDTRESVAELTVKSKNLINVYRQRWTPVEIVAGYSNTSDAEIIECPMDRTKLRVPSGRKRLRVTCSVCKYRFIVNTASAEITTVNSKPGLFKALKAALGRR